MRHRLVTALLATVALVAMPSLASALMVWTLIVTPLVATAEQETTFTLTATNLDPLNELGCLEVTLPDTYEIHELGVPVGPPGRQWASRISGPNTVEVHSLSGGGRLELAQTVTFTIVAMPKKAGATVWPNHAHRNQDCNDADQVGVPLAVTVLPPILPTPEPTPRPTPKPTPKPTPNPTPLPLPVPLPSLPVPLPSVGLPPAPGPEPTRPPSSPAPSPTPEPTSDDRPQAPPGTPVDEGAAPIAPPSSSGGSGGNGAAAPVSTDPPTVAFDEQQLDLGSMDVDLLGGVEIWSVPAATLGVPGILLIIWVGLQAVGALAWIPAVRRLRGDGEPEPR